MFSLGDPNITGVAESRQRLETSASHFIADNMRKPSVVGGSAFGGEGFRYTKIFSLLTGPFHHHQSDIVIPASPFAEFLDGGENIL